MMQSVQFVIIFILTLGIKDVDSAVFTRWGRTECPSGNELVYRGYAASGYYKHSGGSSNILCLPENPRLTHHRQGYRVGSYVYGTEYETLYTPSLKYLHDHDVPCSVCRSQSQRSVIMLPARNECLPGWRMEYWGYLMGGHHTHASSSNYVCVDANPEKAVGGHEDKNGNLLYLTQSGCGALPCPPYREGWDLTCAVCTKNSS